MMTLLKNSVKHFTGIFEHASLNRAAKQLELLSDKQLEDIGVSRELLKLGAEAYPWKVQADNIVQVGFNKPIVADAENDKQVA